MAYVVADTTLYSEANLQKLAYVPMKRLTRVPAAFGERAHSNYLPYDIGQGLCGLGNEVDNATLSAWVGAIIACLILIWSASQAVEWENQVCFLPLH